MGRTGAQMLNTPFVLEDSKDSIVYMSPYLTINSRGEKVVKVKTNKQRKKERKK